MTHFMQINESDRTSLIHCSVKIYSFPLSWGKLGQASSHFSPPSLAFFFFPLIGGSRSKRWEKHPLSLILAPLPHNKKSDIIFPHITGCNSSLALEIQFMCIFSHDIKDHINALWGENPVWEI